MADEVLKLTSDRGKLELAATHIYDFNKGEGVYNKSIIENEAALEANFDATIIDFKEDKATGLGAYALRDETTKEIVIVFVGTQTGKDNNVDVKTDAKIGLNNLVGTELAIEQYDQAEQFYRDIRDEYKGTKITLTGHSLGGGIADTVALRNKQDNMDVLTLNPAPVLNSDVIKYGDGSDMKNVRNIINQNDPLHTAIQAADFTTPGQMYIIPNGAGHSYAFKEKDYDKNGSLIALKTLESHNDTGFDLIPGPFELSASAGKLYTGIVPGMFDRKPYAGEEFIAGAAINLIAANTPVGSIIAGISLVGDLSAANVKVQQLVNEAKSAAIKYSIVAILEIKSAVDTAVDWIETTLAKCKEQVLEVLESVFKAAVDFLAGSVVVYLAASEILEIAKEVAGSYVQDLLDMFKGDFHIDTNVTAIVAEHILTHRHSLLHLFMNDGSRGINRSLLGEISKDVKELSKDLKQLNEDVSEAIFSMIAKDEELGAVTYY
ncbi:lipase [Bacillus pseudomycoides]|uniref:lipase family protein n=1 Tax=Bacillus pseudomycoides TaxID=64104 RepID=UPI000BECA47E|nr:lipase family protein [Bacillus pseudomycoides]PDY47333.1 lipase [Bacillus pseudomycoides]PED69401.1 lipase [Bacillus pseudomycoides]PEI45579.1 lipase [Bacillus pseudomycoides]PEJ66621.1 lipase [Bacillus pseudomycoides]PEM04828.1 lipase [Bacillus pseudomycoides]